MRIALISDVHANLVSLEAVLADIDQAQVDQIIFLGDAATLGPQPCEAVARIKALGCPCVMGNHDSYLLEPELGRAYMDTPWFAENINWCADQLSPADFDFLRTFRPLIEVPFNEGETLLCFHGSPRSNVDMILSMTPAAKLDKMLAGHVAMVMAGGHTHVQMMRQHRGLMLVNAGSVGMPFEKTPFTATPRILPWAEYIIVNWSHTILSVEMRRVVIDLDEVTQVALDSDMPDQVDWVRNWVTF